MKTRPARRAPPKLARASANIFAALAKKTKFIDPSLAESWPALAGERIAALSRPGRITGQGRDKTLEIHVRDGAAASEVQMQSDELIRRLNAYLGPRSLARLHIRQSGRARATPPRPEAREADDDSPLGAALASFRSAVKRRNPDR
ncbi:DciA family protein [Hyphococcus sp.]|uniref:DciA family protein n=1 Tax=Hyphococcus sp. TaxID=2038636 RepID=UPI003CCC20D1